jgi:hypothetical protein
MAVLIDLIAQYGGDDRQGTDHKIKHVIASHGGFPLDAIAFFRKANLSGPPIRVAANDLVFYSPDHEETGPGSPPGPADSPPHPFGKPVSRAETPGRDTPCAHDRGNR